MLGFDAAVEELAAPKSKAAGIILAADISAKTEKEIRFEAEKYGVEPLKAQFTMDEVKAALGKRSGILLILDEGLYISVKKHITD